MALALVPRSARALAEHLNSLYRVLKGVDQDSLWLRLASGGGSFEVRHSVSQAPLFRVVDSGVTMSAGLALPADCVTSANIVDGTIEGRDILDNSIPATKMIGGITIPAESVTNVHIQDGTIRSFELQDGAVTSAKIQDGTIAMVDLAANAVTNSQRVTGGTAGTTNSVSFVDFDVSMITSYPSSGGVLLVLFFATVTTQAIADYVTLGVGIAGTDYLGTSYQPAGVNYRGTALAIGRAQPAAGNVDIRPRWRHSTAARSAQGVTGEATMLIIEQKR